MTSARLLRLALAVGCGRGTTAYMHQYALTQYGHLQGELDAQGIQVFRGIPYAQAPLGELRFRAPQRLAAWSGTRDARAFGVSCPQERVVNDVGPCSEDCLFLNVWTPAVDQARRPVMVWIHGGSFSMGSTSQPIYDAANLARRGDVVVVSINYRLGAFGFADLREYLGADASRADTNNGLRDQVAGLRWVRDNIAAFGGDPENVTLFGESAGAMSLGCLLAVPSARGLFRRAILQSGAAHHALTPEHAAQVSASFLQKLGASSHAPDALWRASAQDILVAQRACASVVVEKGPVGKRLPQGGMTLMPVVDGDFLPEYPLTAIDTGCAADVELIVGTNRDEWNYFVFLSEPRKRTLDAAALHKVCEQRIPGYGAQAIALYREVLGAELPPWQIYSAIETDRTFHVPALRLAEAQSKYNKNTFVYSFDYASALFDGQMGACHALEIPFVFGLMHTQFARTFAGDSPNGVELSDRMLKSWTGFARNGEVSHETLAWERYEVSDRRTLRLDARTQMENDPFQALRAFWAPLH